MIRYSKAFQQKVVSEIESGEINICKAQSLYDIKGGSTIQRWIRKLGKNHLLAKIIRVEMKDEKDKIKVLEKKVKQLESALANEHLKSIALEALVVVAEKHYKTDLKKNFGIKQ
ncbi:MAG: transposase [Candidatus Omnitrophica bacterium]|nr:transposase [Candidatus Omnitrophota bacterium]MCK5493543.1 transposase [Candidatus Omnitrophota bacterium]